MKLFANNKTYTQFQFDREADFEKEIVAGSRLFFGSKSIYIDAKRKIETRILAGTIPDGFLFDLTDINNPKFYIVEVELAKHDFYGHMVPQITKFFGFYKNPKSRSDLIDKIYKYIIQNNDLKQEFKRHLGDGEIFKFVKDTIEKSHDILLIIDGGKKELSAIMEECDETWGKKVTVVQVQKFHNNGDAIYVMHSDSLKNQMELTLEKTTKSDAGRPNGSKAGHIWDTADRLTAEKGRMATRAEVFAVLEGFCNNGTITTQYARWCRFNGTTGRQVRNSLKNVSEGREKKNGQRRPTGAKTGHVWDTADKLTAKKGCTVTRQEMFAALRGFCSHATISTQYARWRKFNGITGRVGYVR